MMIQRYIADGLQIRIEHRIDDGSANALAREIGEPRAHRIAPTRKHREVEEPDPGLALARQDPHQIGIVHRVERVIF